MNDDEAGKELDRRISEDRAIKDEDQRLKIGFVDMNPSVLAEMTDKQLAICQSTVSQGSPQFIRSEHEWQRRILERELRSGRFAAWMGLAGTVLGALLAWLFTKF